MLEQTQRSDQWFKDRLGKFTASRINEILGSTINSNNSYIKEKANEVFLGYTPEKYKSKAMEKGTELEPLAFAKLKEILAKDFIGLNDAYFIAYGEDGGASPDGLCDNNYGAEIKCPGEDKFCEYLLYGKDAISKLYYDQMQLQILAGNLSGVYFFNYIVTPTGEELYHLIEVLPDLPRIELIKTRIKQASIERDKLVELMRKTKQW